MAQVRLAAAAVEDLRELILTHELPSDTPQRVVRRLRALGRFPEMGMRSAGAGLARDMSSARGRGS